jgi:hypothetical protein
MLKRLFRIVAKNSTVLQIAYGSTILNKRHNFHERIACILKRNFPFIDTSQSGVLSRKSARGQSIGNRQAEEVFSSFSTWRLH